MAIVMPAAAAPDACIQIDEAMDVAAIRGGHGAVGPRRIDEGGALREPGPMRLVDLGRVRRWRGSVRLVELRRTGRRSGWVRLVDPRCVRRGTRSVRLVETGLMGGAVRYPHGRSRGGGR